MAWQVVIFVDENRVDAIPKCWTINNDLSYWPAENRKNIVSLIKEASPPDKQWPVVKIRILGNHKVYDNYDEVSKATAKACYTSDLNSDNEKDKDACSKRKIIKNKKYVASSSSSDDTGTEDEDNLPSAPKPKSDLKQKKNIPNVGKNETTSSSEASLLSSAVASNVSDKDKMLVDMIERLCSRVLYLTALIKGMMDDISQVENDLKNLTQKSELLPDGFESISNDPEYNFPFSTKNEFEKFDKSLAEKEHYEKMVRYMVKIGGHKPYDFVKRVKNRIMTDQLGSTFSYTGHKGKQAFKNFHFSKAIQDAAQKVPSIKKKFRM